MAQWTDETESLDALVDWCRELLAGRRDSGQVVESDSPPLPHRLRSTLARHGFDEFDEFLIAVVLAPDLDPALGLAMSELTGVRASRFATVALIADLIGARDSDRVNVAGRLSPGSPLSLFGLIHIVPPSDSPVVGTPPRGPSMLDSCVAATALLRWMFGVTQLDPTLFPLVRDDLTSPDVPPDEPSAVAVEARMRSVTPTITTLVGGCAADLLSTALWAASQADRPALVVTAGALIDLASASRVAAEALLRDAAVIVIGDVASVPQPRWLTLATIVSIGSEPHQFPGGAHDMVTLEVSSVGSASIGTHLVDLLRARGLRVTPVEAGRIGNWNHLRHDELGHIADVLESRARGNDAQAASAVTARDVVRSIVGAPGDDLARLTTPMETSRDWTNLILPADLRAELHELVEQAEHRVEVLDVSGFGELPGQPRGITAVFAGPSGTGKTLASRLVAGELGLPLYAVNLAATVSKYIGETERNLDAVFAAAERSDAVLLFDEAESLFGKRSEVQDAHDRYANLEISFLLQRMERYDGVAILATNLLSHFDDAFARRLAFCLRFPYPDDAQRRLIWRSVWPAGVPLADNIDLDELASAHPLSGGHIRNIALASAHLARMRGVVVDRACVRRAIDREYAKLGQVPETVSVVLA